MELKNGMNLVSLIEDLDGRGLIVTEPDLIKERLKELELFDDAEDASYNEIY